MREPAHGLREWPRAMARRGRRLPDLGISPPSGFPRILARARDDGDRFSTIDNRGRRCLREPAHGLREWPRAMARRGRRLPDLGISAYTPQHAPYVCSHRMQLSSVHLDEAPWADGSAFLEGRIRTPACAHVPHAMQCKHQTVHVHLEERFSTVGIEGRGDPWRGGSEHGTSDERSRRLSDTLTAIPGAC